LRLRLLEIAPVVGLLVLCVVMAIAAGPIMTYLAETAAFLHSPTAYVDAVLQPGANR
jgi:multicomponent K+:H+ antiporter subunit D